MQDNRGRRVRVVAATAVAALVLVGISACGSGIGSDDADRTTTTVPSDGTRPRSDQGDASAELPDPCDLVPIEKASEILGGESAKPDATTNEAGMPTKSCAWQTQAAIDNPTLDGAGHVLSLQVISPPGTMTVEELWKASKSPSDPDAGIAGCDESFWLGGLLSALKDGVYLTGTAGLGDDSPDAKTSVTELVSTACGSLS